MHKHVNMIKCAKNESYKWKLTVLSNLALQKPLKIQYLKSCTRLKKLHWVFKSIQYNLQSFLEIRNLKTWNPGLDYTVLMSETILWKQMCEFTKNNMTSLKVLIFLSLWVSQTMIHINSGIFFFSACVSSLKLQDQPCKLRPTIIAVEEKGFKPHHIELHRCQGTCGNSQPSQKPCVPKSIQQISLDLTDLTSKTKQKVVLMDNHTRCGCDCEAINHCKFDEGEMPDVDNCRCIPPAPTAQRQGGGNEKGLCA